MKYSKITIMMLTILVFISVIPITPAQVSPMMLSNIELVTVDENSAAITWVTNLPANTVVQWGESQDLGDEEVKAESVKYHMGRITGLSQWTTYYYRVGSGERWSDVSSFSTMAAPEGDLLLKVAVVADTHYDIDGQSSPNGMMYEDSVQLTESMVRELNNDASIDLVIVNGDMTNKGTETDYELFASEMDSLDVPWYPVLGNHDKTYPNWEYWYTSYMGRTESYYAFSSDDYRFIILDSAVIGEVQGDLDEAQLSWLEDELDDHSNSPALIFMHHMADRTDINGITTEAKSALDGILAGRSNVLSITSGHIHENHVATSDGNHIYASVAAVVSYPIGYSIIKLYDSGYSQAFHKVESELETSEKSRIKMTSGGASADDDALGDLEDRSFVVEISENNAPEIYSVSVEPSTIDLGGTATVSVSAFDPDGDTLTYIYETSAGTIDGSGSEVIFQSPKYTGVFTIYVEVTDGEFYSTEKSVEIRVMDLGSNHQPVISKVWHSKDVAAPNEIIQIEISAEDDDGDDLTYIYEPTGGSISGSGRKVDWHAPDSSGEFEIAVCVSDGIIKSQKKIITIEVSSDPKESKKDNESGLPGFEGPIFILALLILIFLAIIKHGNMNRPKRR